MKTCGKCQNPTCKMCFPDKEDGFTVRACILLDHKFLRSKDGSLNCEKCKKTYPLGAVIKPCEGWMFDDGIPFPKPILSFEEFIKIGMEEGWLKIEVVRKVEQNDTTKTI